MGVVDKIKGVHQKAGYINLIVPPCIYFYKVNGAIYPRLDDGEWIGREKLLDVVSYLLDNCASQEEINKTLNEIEQRTKDKAKVAQADSGERREELDGFIYVLSTGQGEYKIGLTTKKPTKRLKQIKPKLPYDLEIILVYESRDVYKDEKYYHTKFEEKRLNGEWFGLNKDDIENLKNNGFREWNNEQ